jgi:L-alanine-DL-glutamate epimerase-like enolase superfamily enzyme
MPAGAARNAVDCALWDLQAKLAGTDVSALIGRPLLDRVPSAITIGIDTPEAMAEAARAVAHVPLIKIKVNQDAAEQILAVRAMAPAAD